LTRYAPLIRSWRIFMLPTPPPADEPDRPSTDPPPAAEDDLVTVATFRTAPEAELAKTALDAEGIEAFVADAETVTMDWLLGIAVGDVKIQVARSVAAQAREYLAGRRGTHSVDDPTAPGRCLSCGALFPEDADRCPVCGWSFVEGV
jgi:hypothetical protein